MDLFFIDVVDVVPAREANGPGWDFYLLLVLTILTEAGVMFFMKYNPFKKSLLDAWVVNLVSLAAGFLLIEWMPGLFVPQQLFQLFLLFLITVVLEFPILYLLNRKFPIRKTIPPLVLMNILSYLLFYGYIELFTR